MKRHLIFCIALVAVMASCVKEPYIYRILSDEEAAVVPYRMGQSIRMLNQDGDTLCFTVVNDTTFCASFYDEGGFYHNSKMIEPRPYFYMREVVLQGQPEDSCLLRCRVAPEKVVKISYEKLAHDVAVNGNPITYWHTVLGRTLPLNDLTTTTVTIGETTYENVYVDQGTYMVDTTEVSYVWYYSDQQGLLAAKNGGLSLTLIPN